MKTTKFYIGKIPVIIWGAKSDKVYIYVHGKMSDKESAETFAQIAENKGYQTISFEKEKAKITGVIFGMAFLTFIK